MTQTQDKVRLYLKHKIGLLFCVVFFYVVPVCAQETTGQTIPHMEPNKVAARGLPKGDNQTLNTCPPISSVIFGKFSSKNKNSIHAFPPFPVSMSAAIPYPKEAVRQELEGKAVVAAEILPGGSVGRTSLAQSSGHKILDRAAQDSIKTWKFDQGTEEPDAVPQFVDIPVTFRLKERS